MGHSARLGGKKKEKKRLVLTIKCTGSNSRNKDEEKVEGTAQRNAVQGASRSDRRKRYTHTHTDTSCAYAVFRECEHPPLHCTGSTSCKGSSPEKRHDRNPAQLRAETLQRQVTNGSTGLPELLRHLAPEGTQPSLQTYKHKSYKLLLLQRPAQDVLTV